MTDQQTSDVANDVDTSAADDGGLAEREAAAIAELRKEQPQNDVTPEDPPPAAAESTPAQAVEEDDADKARREKLERLRKAEREAVERSTRLAERERMLGQREEKLADLEKRLTERERAFDDPDAVLSLLEQRVGVEKVSKWFMDATQPEKRAEWAARKVATEAKTELEQLKAEIAALKGERVRETQTAAQRAARERTYAEFAQSIEQAAERAPITARWLKHKREDLFGIAESIAASLPPGSGYEAVIERLEENLGALREIYGGDQQTSPNASTSNSQARPQPIAAAKANTLTNRVASERSSLLTEEEESLSLAERTRRLERRLRTGAA